MKDAWRGPRGGMGSRVGGREGAAGGAWWGKNGGYCTETTMKKKFKKRLVPPKFLHKKQIEKAGLLPKGKCYSKAFFK